jgi:hypothetical protein
MEYSDVVVKSLHVELVEHSENEMTFVGNKYVNNTILRSYRGKIVLKIMAFSQGFMSLSWILL